MMDLPTSLTIAVGTITAGGLTLKLFGRSNSKKHVALDSCKGHREQIEKDLDRGEKKFDKLFQAVKAQGETLARIDERTLIWARKNGVEI